MSQEGCFMSDFSVSQQAPAALLSKSLRVSEEAPQSCQASISLSSLFSSGLSAAEL